MRVAVPPASPNIVLGGPPGKIVAIEVDEIDHVPPGKVIASTVWVWDTHMGLIYVIRGNACTVTTPVT